MKNKEMPQVMSEQQIKQRMAGYKASCKRRINAAKTTDEKRRLEAEMEKYVAEKHHEMLEQNRKARQRLAGYRAWETRRRNIEAAKETRKTRDAERKESMKKTAKPAASKNTAEKSACRKRYCSTKTITVKNK